LKGKHPKIKISDKVILWSGGLWDWLDPLSLIRAVALLVPQHPEIKLFFMGKSHPNPVVSGMSMPEQARKLSEESGLLDKNIFFGEWIPYLERGRYLAESDLAVISHPDHIETHFSFRTRVLDCIWAGLPIISAQGDTLAEWISNNNIGLVVKPKDVNAMASAILNLLNSKGKPSINQSFEGLRKRLQWDIVAEPLIKFCFNPTIAPDKGLYQTETERISKDKDAFLSKVAREKDAFLAQVVHDKDSFFEQVVREKDSARDLALEDQRLHFQEIIDERDATINLQQQQIENYQRSFPVRIHAAVKRLIGR
jgi:glycosyltransferase involved in cell wall biosynthesis